jgi:16S rRNA (cytosine967-C5)-methyltransferase
MVLRVDLNRATVADYLARLAAEGIDARALDWSGTAVELLRPVPVERLPGFGEGTVSVQDAGAQLAAPLLDCAPGMRVLDACAAPGGKTGHLLERTPGLDVLALDSDAGRLRRVAANLERLGRSARLRQGDARNPDALAGERPFERVLVDAPCSATGVIRRHPDIKLLRRGSDIQAFAAVQQAILATCFGALAPGGRLLYVTCSVLPDENEDVVQRFLAAAPEARPAAWPPRAELPPGAVPRSVGAQLLPCAAAGTDGFYYACLEKTTTGT